MAQVSGYMAVNLKQFKERWKRDPDTDRIHQKIAVSKGVFYTHDTRPYESLLTEYDILYSVRQS